MFAGKSQHTPSQPPPCQQPAREAGAVRTRGRTRQASTEKAEMDAQAQELVIKNRYSLLSVSREILKEEHNDVKLLWFYPHEFHLLLEESGFEMEATYADFEFEPMDEPVAYAVFLARKSSA